MNKTLYEDPFGSKPFIRLVKDWQVLTGELEGTESLSYDNALELQNFLSEKN